MPTHQLLIAGNVLAVFAVIALVLFLGCCAVEQKAMFPIDMIGPPPARTYAEVVVLRLAVNGGEVEGWFLPAPGASDQDRRPVVVFAHGNAELIDHQSNIVAGYHRMGISVLLPEYRGYGRSAGRPSQANIGRDMLAMLDMVLERDDVDGSRIVYHGRSLGGAAAANLASLRPPAALIVQSTFTSAPALVGLPGMFIRNTYRTDRVLQSLDRPVLIFHGLQDEVIPVAHGRALAQLVEGSTYVEYQATHNNMPGRENIDDYWAQIERFLVTHGVLQERQVEQVK